VSEWIEVGKVDAIPRLGARVIKSAEGDIAVFRTTTDEVFALRDHCPHKGGPLSQGIVHGKRVTCPLHSWVIDLEDGQAVAPDQGCAGFYAIKIDQGIVYLDQEK